MRSGPSVLRLYTADEVAALLKEVQDSIKRRSVSSGQGRLVYMFDVDKVFKDITSTKGING